MSDLTPPNLPPRRPSPSLVKSASPTTSRTIQRNVLRKTENPMLPPPEKCIHVVGNAGTNPQNDTRLHYVLNDGRLLKKRDLALLQERESQDLDPMSFVLAIVVGGGQSCNDIATSLSNLAHGQNVGGAFGGEGLNDEACVFVLRVEQGDLTLHSMIPIFNDFTIALTKSHQHTTQDFAEDTLTLRLSAGPVSVGLAFADVGDGQKIPADLASFIMTLRRQVHVAKTRGYTRSSPRGNHGWLTWYALQLQGVIRWSRLHGSWTVREEGKESLPLPNPPELEKLEKQVLDTEEVFDLEKVMANMDIKPPSTPSQESTISFDILDSSDSNVELPTEQTGTISLPASEKDTWETLQHLFQLDPCAFNPFILASGTVITTHARIVESIWKEEWLRGWNEAALLHNPKVAWTRVRDCSMLMVTFNAGDKLLDPMSSLSALLVPTARAMDAQRSHDPSVLTDGLPDIIFVCLQEMEAPRAKSMLLGWTDKSLEDKWIQACQHSLNNLVRSVHNSFDNKANKEAWKNVMPDSYGKWTSARMVGLFVVAFARMPTRFPLSDLTVTQIGTGLMGMGGNKGGLCLRFRLGSSWISVVNAHLAADDSAANGLSEANAKDDRNEDFQEICSRARFPVKIQPLFGSGQGPVADHGVQTLSRTLGTQLASHASRDPLYVRLMSPAITGNAFAGQVFQADLRRLKVVHRLRSVGALPHAQNTIFDADHLIFLGDLNYRLNGNPTEIKAMVSQAIEAKNMSCLLVRDQLTQLLHTKSAIAFRNFSEGEITFPPTYKYVPGSINTFDDKPSKPRTPSYTDRVLWYNPPRSSSLTVQSYQSLQSVTSSDHKPVKWEATLPIVSTIPPNLDSAVKRMSRIHDSLEMLCVGQIKVLDPLDGNVILTSSTPVKWWNEVSSTLTVANVGSVQVRVTIKNKDWFTVDPETQVILPSQAMRFRVRLCLKTTNDDFARDILLRLNAGTLEIGQSLDRADSDETIMVINVDNGADKFFVCKVPQRIVWDKTFLASPGSEEQIDQMCEILTTLPDMDEGQWKDLIQKARQGFYHGRNDGIFEFQNPILQSVFSAGSGSLEFLHALTSGEPLSPSHYPRMIQLAWAWIRLYPTPLSLEIVDGKPVTNSEDVTRVMELVYATGQADLIKLFKEAFQK